MMFTKAQKKINNKIVFWALFIVVTVFFFLPLDLKEATGLGLDKAYHFFVFFILAYLGNRSHNRFWVVIGLTVYVVVVELIQGSFIPNRSYDPLDAISGFLGILVETGFYLRVKRNIRASNAKR